MSLLCEKEVHEIIISHYFTQSFPQWIQNYEFPSAIILLIINIKYAEYDKLLFCNTDNSNSYAINLLDVFPNICSNFISNVPNNNGILLLNVKYQTIIVEWKDYQVLLSFICCLTLI